MVYSLFKYKENSAFGRLCISKHLLLFKHMILLDLI